METNIKEVSKKSEAERRADFLSMAEKIDGYTEWKKRYELMLTEKKQRQKAFELVLALIPKFESFSLSYLAWTLGVNKRTAGTILKEWKKLGKVIVLTEQTIGHPYKIVVNQ